MTSLVQKLIAANARLQLEAANLRESNAWYRARNVELLRLLAGRKVVDTESPPAPYIRSENARLG